MVGTYGIPVLLAPKFYEEKAVVSTPGQCQLDVEQPHEESNGLKQE